MLHLIFDFDGVIGNTWDAAVKSHQSYGSQPSEEKALEEMNRYFSKKPHHAKDHSLTEEELAKEYKWTSEFGEHMNDHGFNLFTDFVSEIEKLESPHKAVVSSGSHNYVDPALASTNISFTHVLAFEDGHSKEEKIDQVCKDWGVDVSEVYYFTDTLADVYELQNIISKDKLVGVSWGFCSKEQLQRELDDSMILDQASDITSILNTK